MALEVLNGHLEAESSVARGESLCGRIGLPSLKMFEEMPKEQGDAELNLRSVFLN